MRSGAIAAGTVTLLAISGLSTCRSNERVDTAPGTDAPVAIDPAAIESHMQFLAGDALRGREPGTEGFRTAAAYVVDDFRASGLEPAGDDDTYVQTVPLRLTFRDNARAGMEVRLASGSHELVSLQDFVIDPEPAHPSSTVVAPVVFAGFGIEAPELGVDDYAGLNVEGSIVLVVRGAPDMLPTDARAHLARTDTKARSAAAHGAIGMLRVTVSRDDGPDPFAAAVRGAESGSLGWIDDAGAGHDAAADIRAGAVISRRTAELLFTGSPRSFGDVAADVAAGRPLAGFALAAEVSLEQAGSARDFESPNVVARLAGSDPALRREHVVITAHLDHVGVGPPADGDDIYNGAGDNASGTAVLLEIARSFGATPDRPRRSILFVALTAEERGLVGSDFFVHNPPVPVEDIVANINLDSGVFLYDFADIIPFGTTYSTLGDNVRRVAVRAGLEVGVDPLPEEALFTRSDHYRFVQQGIPSMFFMCGMTARDPAIDGLAELRRYVSEHLHRPSDDMTLPWHFGAAARYAAFVADVARDIADADGRPAWREGNVFARLGLR